MGDLVFFRARSCGRRVIGASELAQLIAAKGITRYAQLSSWGGDELSRFRGEVSISPHVFKDRLERFRSSADVGGLRRQIQASFSAAVRSFGFVFFVRVFPSDGERWIHPQFAFRISPTTWGVIIAGGRPLVSTVLETADVVADHASFLNALRILGWRVNDDSDRIAVRWLLDLASRNVPTR